MDIKKSEFTISAATVSQCPKDTKPEFAFIGRSNVGKSSLINMLCNHKGLAKTSATPGKTLLINHFIINNDWYLVDLPGYGFAKRSKTVQKKLDQMITSYILQRQQLVNTFVLIDIRHDPMKIDTDFINWLGESSVPFSIIFTNQRAAFRIPIEIPFQAKSPVTAGKPQDSCVKVWILPRLIGTECICCGGTPALSFHSKKHSLQKGMQRCFSRFVFSVNNDSIT